MNEDKLRQLAMLSSGFNIQGQPIQGRAIVDQPDVPLDSNIVRRLMSSTTVSPAQANHQATLDNIMRQSRFQAKGYGMDELGDTSDRLEAIARETNESNAHMATEQGKLTKAGLAAQAISQNPSASNRKQLASLMANLGINVDPAVDGFLTYPQLFQLNQQEQAMDLERQKLALSQQALAAKSSGSSEGSGGRSYGGKQMTIDEYNKQLKVLDELAGDIWDGQSAEDMAARANYLQRYPDLLLNQYAPSELTDELARKVANDIAYIQAESSLPDQLYGKANYRG